jgi:O-antigen/teichoic acid export membrane protein
MLTLRSRALWVRLSDALRAAPLVSIGGVNALMLLVNVAASLLLIRYLPKEAYGQLVYFYAGVGLTRLLMNFGLGPYITREIAATSGDAAGLRRVVYSTLTVRAVSIALMWLAVIALNALTAQPFLFYIALAGFFASLADIVFAIVSGLRLIRGVALITIAQPVMYLALALGFMVFGQSSAELLMLLAAFSYLLMLAVGLSALRRSGQVGAPQPGDLVLRDVRKTVIGTLPIYLNTLLSQVYLSINGGALGGRGDFVGSANYGAAFNLITMVLGLSGLTLGSTFYPLISQLAAQDKRAELIQQTRGAISLVLRLYLLIAVLMAAFPETIVTVLYGVQYDRSAVYLLTLAPVAVLMGVAPIFAYVLQGLYRQGMVTLIYSAQVATLIGLLAVQGTLSAADLAQATLIASLFGALLLIGVTVWALKALPFRWVDAAAVGVALISALVLRQVQIAVGVELSLWHFAAGAAFLLVYGAVWVITEKIQWVAPSHSS